MSIAASGMAAATRRLEVSARNVANARSDGPLPSAGAAVTASFGAPFTPWRVDQVEVAGGGTYAQVSAVDPGQVPSYDPDAPYADQNGLVAARMSTSRAKSSRRWSRATRSRSTPRSCAPRPT